MSELSEGFQQLKELLIKLEDISICQSVDSVGEVLEAIELAARFESYESTASSLLLQTSANLWERVKQFELTENHLTNLVNRLKDVGFSETEIVHMLDLEDIEEEEESLP